MPFNSYPELASAATWYPAPVAYLEGYDDLTTLADLQHVSWCFRGIVVAEPVPSLNVVHQTVALMVHQKAASLMPHQKGVTVMRHEKTVVPG